MAAKRHPRNKTDAEFAGFVEENDLAPYLDGMKRIDKALALAPELVDRIRERAKRRLNARR